MKPVGIALLLVCLSSVVVGGVVLAAPEINPAWSVGALALLAAALLVTHNRPEKMSAKPPLRKRVVFQRMVRVKNISEQGRLETDVRPRGLPGLLLRIVDARGTSLPARSHGSRSSNYRSKEGPVI